MNDEFFYLDAKGRKADAALHDEILNNPDADLACRLDTARRLVAKGMDEQTARNLYGIPMGGIDHGR